MTNKKWYKKPEMIVAMSALVMTLVTTTVSVYSAYIDRSYARASVWPRLQIYRSYGDTHFSYGVNNPGNGPSIIKYAKVTYQSKPISRWNDIPEFPQHIQSHLGQLILAAQDKLVPMTSLRNKPKDNEKFLEIDKSVEIELCYCSIYNECWLVNRANNPKSIKSCVIDPKIAFKQ
ncbi:hypothetical protein D5R81_05325 [Parashewanella spongiae]|uniref:Uncharacterized protein n=1 Tax=Parashewanella spongiae TaxID=342950 RepID=A0A3A6U932_9GAMM|nr:hypothetical protein [Parashewanella spongiae]MCL1077923.1 hypothetical protein [Parashewanella spongiae]RJY18456.1 hypothetical protein D5R81_05325 [Parashewanella spongiae]